MTALPITLKYLKGLPGVNSYLVLVNTSNLNPLSTAFSARMRGFGDIKSNLIKSLPNPLLLNYGIERRLNIAAAKQLDTVLMLRRAEIRPLLL